MKKRITSLFVVFVLLITAMATTISSFSVSAAVSSLTFETFNEGQITTDSVSYADDEYVTSVRSMGGGGTLSVIKESNLAYARLLANGSSTYIGIYAPLSGFVAGTYKFTITLRLSEGYTLQDGKNTIFRFESATGTNTNLDTLYANAVATTDADGFRTVTFEKTTTEKYASMRLFTYATEGSYVDIKEIAFAEVEESTVEEVPPVTETEADTLVDLSEYTIVYGKYEAEELMLDNPTYASLTEWDFNRLIAEELKANIKDEFGVDLPIVKDTATDFGDKEILVGNTNRKDYQGYLGLTFVKDAVIKNGINTNYSYSTTNPFKYAYGLQGNDIYMVGGTYATTYEASLRLFDYLKENVVNGQVNLTASWKVTGTKDLDVIGCIGDSITQGYRSKSADTGASNTYCYFAYPSYLQRMNWKTAYVYNLGRSARSMLSTLSNSYQSVARWTEAKKIKDVLDYVVIALGTNDSKLVLTNEARDWTDADSAQFIKDFFVIIETLTENNKDIKFIFSNCPKNYSSGNYAKDFILDLQAQCVTEAKKEGYTIELFDMNTYSTQNMPSSTHYYSDKLHPNTVGYHEMAKGINGALEDIGLNDTPDTPNTPDTPDTPVDDDKGGCGSVITVGSALLSVVLLGGAVVMLKKKD